MQIYWQSIVLVVQYVIKHRITLMCSVHIYTISNSFFCVWYMAVFYFIFYNYSLFFIKPFLIRLMPQILRVLNHDTSKDRNVTLKLLEALRKFGNNLDDYLHLVLPPIVKLFDAQDCPIAVSREALKTVTHLAPILDFSDFISRVVHPLVRTLDTNPELRETAMGTLTALVRQLGKKYNIFVPLVQKVMLKHKIHCVDYEKLVLQVSGFGYFICLNTKNLGRVLERNTFFKFIDIGKKPICLYLSSLPFFISIPFFT